MATEQMKRIVSNSVTEALMKVMEDAEEIDEVVILYRYKELLPNDNAHYAIQHNEECTLKDANWLVDMFKSWLHQRFSGRED